MWYPVKGYEGLYEITRDGRVRSTYRRRVELRPFFKKVSRQPYINLYRDGDLCRRSVPALIKESIPA